MAEEFDFSKFENVEEALDAWLQPSLSFKIAINIPAAFINDPSPPLDLTGLGLDQHHESSDLILDQQPHHQSSELILDQEQEVPSELRLGLGYQQPQHELDHQPHEPTSEEQEPSLIDTQMEIFQPSSSNHSNQSPPSQDHDDQVVEYHHHHTSRFRRYPAELINQEPIVPAFPWATDRRATLHTLEHLIANGITSIEGEVQCKRCLHKESVTFDLLPKFREVENMVRERMGTMNSRAAEEWVNPVFPDCEGCKQPNCMKPVLAENPQDYNWLFLFLGQSLGMLTLQDIKWFCKHTYIHRTGSKNRVLYYTYMTIGKQLDPASEVFIRPLLG